MPSNTAAWLTAAKAPLEVKSAPYTSPGENEVVIKNGAVAINPVDWAIQAVGTALFSWITYPTILGQDIAGEVVEVGSAVSRFKIGDRVLGHALGIECRPHVSAFQEYTVLQANLASPIPSTLSYENAAVLPLGLSTAASGLFQKDYLALQHPSVPPKPTGKALLIWGGATSVGSNGIQLAVAAGYEVITTASPKNFDYVKKLGASQAFDYHSKTIVDELVAALNGKIVAGVFDSIGVNGVFETCADVLLKTKGNKFIATCKPPPEKIPDGVSTKFIFGSSLKNNEVGDAIYANFLPKALAEGKYIVAPDPEVVGKGLEYIQAGFDLQKKGMSAKKVVISL
ncbi:MAG: hypothetical protein M1834_004529 [Cirrosporium novae-zelandiae]|nr:MAG: hypothetical protein M1834_004529 [Cirrosporium novae-zelandiae]